MKRLFDVVVAGFVLAILSPFLLALMLCVWLQDRKNPLYIAPRALSKSSTFDMVKLRSMVTNADKQGGVSTADGDRRVTPIGQFIRRYKFDELIQLWNVLRGDMSLVGPRPQVMRDVQLYTEAENALFRTPPGITDFASIVFADEGEILKGSENPDLKYNQVIRPWKSRLGLFYAEHSSVGLDVQLIYLTVVGAIDRKRALAGVQRLLKQWGADPMIIEVAGRQRALQSWPPPGSDQVETRC